MYIEISKKALDLVNKANLREFSEIYRHKEYRNNCLREDMSETTIKNYINVLEYLVEKLEFDRLIKGE